MRKLVVNEFLSLDGVAQAPNMEDEAAREWVLRSIVEAGGYLALKTRTRAAASPTAAGTCG